MAQPPRFLERRLNAQPAGAGHLLEAVRDDQGAVRLFFQKGLAAGDIAPGAGLTVTRQGSIGGAALLYGTAAGDPVRLCIAGAPVSVDCHRDETALFAGLRSGLVIRNGESPEITRDWIAWHADHFGMQAVLLVDRARPGAQAGFAARLRDLVAPITGLRRVVVLTSALPLGAPDRPHEAHPINVPGAPGKDRMQVPPPDPWTAPLDCGHLFELLRARFLGHAGAVLSLDLHDLVRPDGDNPFARAEAGGVVLLEGRACYPWRVRSGHEPVFADHICVPFDGADRSVRWCVAPETSGADTIWRPNRIVGAASDGTAPVRFDRHMAIRHEHEAVARIVPKSSLIEDPRLLERSRTVWHHKPVRPPARALAPEKPGPTRTVIVTCMKNEGPFILEWLAYHRAIGVTDFLVYTNDCDDGTDAFLDLLQARGLVQHRDNPFRATGQKPQHAALAASDEEPAVQQADWAISMDVDEFINIKTGDGTLAALFAALPEANLISCTWRLFGNSDIHHYDPDESLLRDYTRCAREFANKPHQAWGFKTLFRRIGIFKKMGVHRPKGLNAQLWNEINWVNGSGALLPPDMFRNAWRSTSSTYGYDLVQLNHYAVRSAESFLVKRDRGRVNHTDRDQGLAYWFRMNNNGEEDRSIQARIPMMEAERARLLADPGIRAAHEGCIRAHRAKIDALMARPDQRDFYATLTGPRMQRLARLHRHFGANVFLGGPDTVPDAVAFGEHEEDFFFTVDAVAEARH